MNPIFKFSLLFFCLMALVPGASRSFAQTPQVTPFSKSTDEPVQGSTTPIAGQPDVASAQTQFAIGLFQNIRKEHPNENLLVSPLSADGALEMALNGAGGQTRKDMAQALGLGDIPQDQVNSESSSIYQSLSNPGPNTQLNIANSIWADNRAALKDEFVQVNQQYYGATLENLDFGNPKAFQTINDWVSDKTKGKIPQIIDGLSPDQVLVLLNAVYFKGLWKDPFPKNATASEPFYLYDGGSAGVPTMIQRKHFYPYQKTDLFQAVCLPYMDDRLSLVIFLPVQGKSLEDFCASLNPDTWNLWMAHFQSTRMNLTLPKFKIEYSMDLIPPLKSLGMGSAFSGQADFSGISATHMHISQAIQKTFMEVNEEGTEAAAATALLLTANIVEHSVNMDVDRPFFFALYDQETRTILFMGTMLDPRK